MVDLSLNFDSFLGCKVKKIYRNLVFTSTDCDGELCNVYLSLFQIEEVDSRNFCVSLSCGDVNFQHSMIYQDDWFCTFDDALKHYHKRIIRYMKNGKL